jgi:hypothetical protein
MPGWHALPGQGGMQQQARRRWLLPQLFELRQLSTRGAERGS